MVIEKCVVSWLDPAFSLDEEDVRPVFTETMGWIVLENETKKYLVIASERLGSDGYRGFTAIPRCLVVSVEGLEGTDGRHTETEESTDGASEEGEQEAS